MQLFLEAGNVNIIKRMIMLCMSHTIRKALFARLAVTAVDALTGFEEAICSAVKRAMYLGHEGGL